METLEWKDWRGREHRREVYTSVEDISKFEGRAGYAWLVICANPHLTYLELAAFLKRKGVERSETWLRRRRWMFHPSQKSGPRPDADLRQKRAFNIMYAHPRLSVRALTRLLAEQGIKRSREWVRMNRVPAD